MNYYNEIKKELINNEIYKKTKDYAKNKSDLMHYYNVGKLLNDAGKKYGEGIITQYAVKLEKDIGKKYNTSTLLKMKKFYILFSNENVAPPAPVLTWSHYIELLPIKDINEINYYIDISIKHNLSRNKLRDRIRNKEYQRLDDNTKNKLIKHEEVLVTDFIKNPIIINGNLDINKFKEKYLKELILNDLDNFLKELGNGFMYVGNEYEIKIGNRFHYIDILLYNVIHNCYIVVELKTREIKKQDIGQIEIYMNYINKHLKTINQDDTIGIILCKKDNKLLLEYCSDQRIFSTTFILQNI